jgi:signal transduction histidine kinase
MKAHQQLKIHDKMQREFINIAAHELRTPIQPIIGLTEVVRSKIKDKQLDELQGVIIRNAKRLERLTEDILDVTKIESQSLKLNKEQFNLNDVITNAIDDITTNKGFFGSEKNNAIKILYQPQDIFVQADEGRISQVIYNLLDNAIKFTKEKEGGITIIVQKKEEDNDQVIISIKDTGEGIDPEISSRLFTKFATKSKRGGTGLGLFISKSIIEAHGGRIWAENNRDDIGATFYFSLPLSI